MNETDKKHNESKEVEIIEVVEPKETTKDIFTALTPVTPKIIFSRLFKILLIPVVVILLVVIYFVSAPLGSFDKPLMIEISSGDSLKTISKEIQDDGVIRSAGLLRIMVSVYGGQNNIKAGVYEFDRPAGVFSIAYRLSHQKYGYVPVRLTFPEGINSREILSIINSKFPNLATSTSVNYISDQALVILEEGYMFPDTYFFPPNVDVKTIVERMSSEYKMKIQKYESSIQQSGHTEAEIMTMASILEEEVKSPEDRKLVSDLLWRRIANGMPLQVDSTLGYINGKKSSDLTQSDLATSSAFNTYKNKGLPPTPISNPGIDAIEAAISPVKNDYIFFLTGDDGKTHFSKTYAEHLKFKGLYIR